MEASVLVKTQAGLEEIQTRRLHLTPRLRALLVVIDGKHGKDAVIGMAKAIGVTQENVEKLVEMGLIAYANADPQTIMPSAEEKSLAERPAVEEEVVVPVVLEGGQKIMALYELFNGFIRPTFGLRAFMLQLELEKCSNLDDYRTLANDILNRLNESNKKDTAAKFLLRVEAIMGPLKAR